MLVRIWCIYLILNISSAAEIEIRDKVLNSSDTVLCRFCGSDILTTDSIISKLSPVRINEFKDTIFNKDEILVQVLTRDSILQLPIITATNSACSGIGEWEQNDNWFPGYHWKTCACSECGALLGWIFEPLDPQSVIIPEQFFGLLVDQLVSGSCK